MRFGGDYNPEQWPPATLHEDVDLMKRAGVNLVTVGVFSWAWCEPRPDEFELDWLDRAMDALHGAGIGVDLATATASPPPWLAARHPETLPVDATGARLWPGSRQAYCPSSPVFRDRARRLVTRLAERYAEHPALEMWHVGNEYACHVTQCWCDVSAAAFRSWLRERYGSVEALNEAWGTSFWSQRYDDFDEVVPPRLTPSFVNPTQRLDFRRFSSDEHLACYLGERDVLRRLTPDVPITTNFMANRDVVDYWAWSDHVDVVSNDHYVQGEHPRKEADLAFTADVSRGLARGGPWLLMEHSTSAVNWQPRNLAKRPGEMLRHSLAHLARGADGALFFQWRQSRAGAEKYHSALVPHAGTETRVFREVERLGALLADLEPVVGSTVATDVALLLDWQAGWVCEGDATPTCDVAYRDCAQLLHAELMRRGITTDVVRPGEDLGGYRLALVPTLTMVTDAQAAALTDFVDGGGHVLVTYFSGIVDEHDRVRLGGYPGAFRDLLGVVSEELCPLPAGGAVTVTDTSGAVVGSGHVWTEDLQVTGAEPVLVLADGPVPGRPALTRHEVGSGTSWYLTTRPDDRTVVRVLDEVLAAAGVVPPVPVPDGVESVVRRSADGRDFHFLINHTDGEVEVPVSGTDLVSGRDTGPTVLPAGGVAVVSRTVP